MEDEAGVLNDAFSSAQRDIYGARGHLTTVSIVLAVWGVIISVGLVVLVSVAFTRLRRNRFLVDNMEWPSQKGPTPSDAEYGRPVGGGNVSDDDDEDDDEYTDDELRAVGSDAAPVTAAPDRQIPPATFGRLTKSNVAAANAGRRTVAMAKASSSGQRTVILESDLDPDDLPIDVSGSRLAGLFSRHLENYSEDELNSREAVRLAAGQLSTVVHAPPMPSPRGTSQ